MIWWALSVYLLLGVTEAGRRHDKPLVETSMGLVRGYTMTSRSGRQFSAFTRIPYAKPPVGELRFQPPRPMERWTGELDATKEPPFCIQVLTFLPTKPIHGVEDCLYLSVYTHNISGEAPVLFHIHGGAFVFGTGKVYGPQYLMDEDLVVVNINYRLGIFGFLSFENSLMPGNQGMKDQVLALKWVQDNIASFGGDPNQVTIIGESAGGASVYHHIVSPLSKGLFQQGIAESGTSYALWALSPPGFAKTKAERLMTLLRCPLTPEEGIACALKKDARTVVSKAKYFTEWLTDPILNFGPVIEEEGTESFLVGAPSTWNHNPVPLLMGMTSAEGLMRTLLFVRKRIDLQWFSDNFESLAPISLLYYATSSQPEEVTRRIREYYLKDGISMSNWVNFTTMYTDGWFTHAVLDGANNHTGDVYFYYFDYPWDGSSFVSVDQDLLFGSNHVDEMKFIWELTIPFASLVEKEEDVQLSQRMVKVISNFVQNGTPSLEDTELKWEKWTPEDDYYVHINREGFNLKKGLLKENYNFWKSLTYRDKYEETLIKEENVIQ